MAYNQNQTNSKKTNSIDENISKYFSSLKLFYDENSQIYAEITTQNGTKKLLAIESDDFIGYVQLDIHKQYKYFPQPNKIRAYFPMLRVSAKESGIMIKSFNRVARLGNVLYLDLMDNKNFVEIDANGFRIVNQPPVHFKQYNNQVSMPIPGKSTAIEDFLDLLNLQTEHDRILVATWIVCSYFYEIERPILIMQGPSGSRKSNNLVMIKSLIDPSINISSPPSSINDLIIALSEEFIPCLDNISSISKDVSDLFCRCYTGTSSVKKRLYTDLESVKVDLFKPIMLSMINTKGLAHDLVSRSIFISAGDEDDSIKPKSEEMVKFKAILANALATILEAVSKTMMIVDKIHFDSYFRIADYQKYGCAAAIALGFSKEAFMDALYYNEAKKKPN